MTVWENSDPINTPRQFLDLRTWRVCFRPHRKQSAVSSAWVFPPSRTRCSVYQGWGFKDENKSRFSWTWRSGPSAFPAISQAEVREMKV